MQNPRCRNLLLILALFLCLTGGLSANASLQLTEDEFRFLQEHPTVSLGVDPKFMPFEFLDEKGVHSGIASDLLALISERTGLHFSYDPSLSWSESVKKAEKGEIEVLAAVGYTAERAQYLLYLPPYLHYQRAIIVQKNNTSITSLKDLLGRQVAVQQESSHEGFLTSYPSITPRLYATVEDALLAVNQGGEIAFIGNEATSSYLSRSLGLTELKVIPLTESSAQPLHIAVQRNQPLLASIMGKALDSISESELAEILNRWIRYETTIDYRPIIRAAIAALSIVLIAFALSSFWIVRLRKAIREKEEAQRKAEEADTEKSRFLARISHEIRTPLNGINGMSFLLEKTQLDPTQRRYLTSIASATHTMQEIINDILEYSRLQENRVTLESVPFHLDDVLENCVSIEQYLIRQKGLDLRITEGPGIPKRLIGDPTRISQILINLLNNAMKFTESGSITLSIASRDNHDSSCTLSFQIIDTGIGMSKEQLDTIFIPFVQANATIHRKYGGSGLGLSIVKELIDKMNGTLEVESEEQVGTKFTVTLPLQVDTREEEAFERSVDFSSIKALLVIQDRVLNDRIISILNEYQIQWEGVTSFHLGAKALRDSPEYDLIIFEFTRKSSIPDEFITLFQESQAQHAKLLALVHGLPGDSVDTELPLSCDLVLTLPLITSVLFNGLLQLFGKGVGASSLTQSLEPSPMKSNLTVLVVEDNPTNQIIAKELLQQIGATVILADNGKQGYELFMEEQARIDCILMDLHMDVMDGYESSSLIRERDKEVPILVTSADLLSSVVTQCKEIGVNEVIAKPYDPRELQKKVQEYGSAYREHNPVAENANIDVRRGVQQVGGNEEIYRKILASFIHEMPALTKELEDAGKRKDWDTVKELAHKAKGSCGAIGASGAQKLCAQLQIEQSAALVVKTLDELERVIAYTRSYLGL